ncbi:hypothetical protein BJY04DRAFT_175937 [Aspergillus karnatakaensis]|uniref:putative GPI-anchored cell surface glycoprotein n=1 Tax=Aspergillus karnatakaensis TaxID=1810916 RepID=UPI003CCD2B2F
MSLNGLDNPTVIEAYQIALAEAGGWFLLRYVSRDEVTLHERGTGGVPDVRNAIEGYEECSPLYGFLQYRRRKVVLSYLPEELSRLVRARTTVQFQSVLDKFSPHDTVFSLSQPSDLTESALSSACLLHTASGSITSSSSSLRRRRLMEIAEDAEETPTKESEQPQAPTQDTRQRSFSQVSEATVVPPSVISTPPELPNGDVSVPTSPDDVQINGLSPSISLDQHSERPTSSRHFRDDLSLAPSESRQSTQSARPSLRDLERAAGYKPKVKLGPRPSVDGSGRPRTAGNLTRSVEQRPVASLPAGVRASPFRKSNPSPARPRSQGNPVATPSAKVPPVPPLLVPPSSMSISRPQLSPGAKSLSALSTSTTSNEKERLMKALQLRKSQMQKRAQEAKQVNAASGGESRAATQGLNDDKENVRQLPEKARYDKGRQRLSSISEHDNKVPLSELQPETPELVTAAFDLVKRQEGALSEPSNTEPVVDTVGDQSNYILPRTTYSETAPEATNIEETVQEAQVPLSEPETNLLQDDLTGSTKNDIKSGASSPSAPVNVPPEDIPQKALEEEIVATISPPAEEDAPITNDTVLAPATQSTEPILPSSIPLPESPASQSRPASVIDSSTIIASKPAEFPTPPPAEPVDVEQEQAFSRKDKRRPVLEPIQVPTPDYSDDDNLLSDDSFMEELKSATVEEAKPVSVGKTPLSPNFSNRANTQVSPDAWRNSRAVSNPSAIGHQYPNAPTFAGGRAVSSPFSQAENSSGPVLVAKKINVSSGISKRIKALEQFSSIREGASTPVHNVSTPTTASFEALRKRASVSHGGSHTDTSLSRNPSYAPEPFSRAPSFRRPDSRASTNAERTTNSVSVTARIVRDPDVVSNDANSAAEPRALNLQASPLTVERGTPENTLPQNPTPESTPNRAEVRSMSVSSAGSAKPPPAVPPRSESRLSLSSRNDGYFLSRSPSETSASSPEEKKESRTSRLLRRMSSITSSSRRSTIGSRSPVVEESTMPPVQEGPKNTVELPAAVDIGEVNVQFPDTLLWKRRFIRVDSKGYLVLTPGNIDSSNRSMVKRYHLTEFRTPCLPDEERQELPNSILLDFLDGSTLQCACESRQGQSFVLQTLLHAHGTHQQLV